MTPRRRWRAWWARRQRLNDPLAAWVLGVALAAVLAFGPSLLTRP